MKSILGWIRFKLPVLLTYGVLLGLCFFVFVYKQNSLIPGANTYEVELANKIEAYEYPWRKPADSPFATVAWIISKMTFMEPITAARFLTAISATLSVYMFYVLLRNWLLSPGKALVGTILFATSSWTLAIGRGAYSSTLGIFLLLLIFTLGSRLLFTTRPFIDWVLLISATCVAVYTPLIIWLVFIAGIISMLHYKDRQKGQPIKRWQKIIIGFLAGVLLTPLVIGLLADAENALILLGIDSLVDSIPTALLSMIDSLKTLFIANTADLDSPLALGRLPLLDIFSAFMFLLGLYYFERRLKLKRSKLLFGGFALGLIVTSLSGFDIVRFSLLLPIVYIFVAAGIHEAITRWLAVFPRNPLARSLGVIMITVVVGFVGSYHLRRTFLARPGNVEVVSRYQISLQ